ncbi:DUF3991 and toprim domain-containing protein [Rhizobium leguminosarum]|uniref:DUF3991 and toprim domain-containing protein n=1 Tax=Rhizobium leguminosarum TaxID=384 RepID=UPI001C968C88|nr:DUF3991 and toprim domain-containing protein [Rhizobium leguminosarum]MBY5827399.1 DUF3991 domain-containing protein [Rhizobium leguminosarum]
MNRKKVEELRERVSCAAVLDKAGFAVDLRESTRRAVKYRRDGDIIIVTHAGRGWFDPLSEAKGDVFSLVEHLAGVGFADGLRRVAELTGYEPEQPAWKREVRERIPDISIEQRWRVRRRPWPRSFTWRYLADGRFLSEEILRAAMRQDRLRQGPCGSIWAAHTRDDGTVTGWEERGPQWRSFATGGTKVLFRFGQLDAPRACVTEAAIDAMSLAAIESRLLDSLYLSTGGGWAPATEAAIRILAASPGMLLVAATDNNAQGDVYSDRIERIARHAGCAFQRLRPSRQDWNEDLEEMRKQEGRKKEDGLPHARRSHQG